MLLAICIASLVLALIFQALSQRAFRKFRSQNKMSKGMLSIWYLILWGISMLGFFTSLILLLKFSKVLLAIGTYVSICILIGSGVVVAVKSKN